MGKNRSSREAAQAERPPSSTPGAIRSRRWRARRDRGKAVVEVEYDADVVDLLVRNGWMGDHEATDPREIGRAIAAMLAEAARH